MELYGAFTVFTLCCRNWYLEEFVDNLNSEFKIVSKYFKLASYFVATAGKLSCLILHNGIVSAPPLKPKL